MPLLVNLVDNSIKFRSPDRPLTVEVRITDVDDRVEIVVDDNGSGLGDDVEELFESGVRGDNAAHVPGSGLGVSFPLDPGDPLVSGGFMFRGRINEDFKLSTGTWVRVGALRARLLAGIGDLAQDVAIAGHHRESVAALIFPNVLRCRALAQAGPDVTLTEVFAHEAVREAFESRLDRYNRDNPGSSTAIDGLRWSKWRNQVSTALHTNRAWLA